MCTQDASFGRLLLTIRKSTNQIQLTNVNKNASDTSLTKHTVPHCFLETQILRFVLKTTALQQLPLSMMKCFMALILLHIRDNI